MQFLRMICSISKVTIPCAVLAGLAGSASANVVIGSFTATSDTPAGHSQRPFATDPTYSDIHLDLSTNFAATTGQTLTVAAPITTASSSTLSGDNVFVLDEVSTLDPLSASEVTALKNFVLAGHDLVLISDTSAFGKFGSNQVLSALGEGSIGAGTGGISGNTLGLITHSGLSTSGPFGTLVPNTSTFATFEAGTINPGPDVNVIGTAGSNNMLAEIPAGKLGAGAGSVLIASSAFFQNTDVTGNDNNRILFENYLASVPEPTAVSFLAFGAIGLLRRRRA